jgi:mRNA-degrading endonuclease YafQ of YafQ-DinJ toxin-antitoxin module
MMDKVQNPVILRIKNIIRETRREKATGEYRHWRECNIEMDIKLKTIIYIINSADCVLVKRDLVNFRLGRRFLIS